jgi:glycosyltransferase involved in cell wall biosynthesis
MSASLREHHPDAALTVLLLDADPGEVQSIAGAHMLGLREVVGAQWGLLAAANPPGALTLAVLPYLMREVLASRGEPALYIGAGERLTGPLTEIEQLLVDHEILVVARATGESAPDAMRDEVLRGAYSRELFGFRSGAGATALLDIWPRYFATARDDGAGAVRAWLDSIPARADRVAVLRDSGYGLDAFSLAGLSVGVNDRSRDDGLVVSGRPARVFDFASLDPEAPDTWLDAANGVRLSSTPVLWRLALRHAEELRAAGSQTAAESAPPFTELDDGLRLTDTMRTLLVTAVTEGAVAQSPLLERGRIEFYDYLNAPGERGQSVGLTRLHMAIWEDRPDLQSAYPHLDGPDGEGFAGWLCLYAAKEEGVVAELLPPTPELAYRDANPNVHETAPRWGVNLVGFFTSELGVGEVARLLVAGLDAQGIPVLPIQGHLLPPSRQGVEFASMRPDDAAYPINVLCINGDGVPVFAREAGRSFFEGRHSIAVWFWEVGNPPASWQRAYDFVDEVWVASQYTYDLLAPTSPAPVVKMTLPLPVPLVAARTRAELGVPEEGFIFLYVHDYHSVCARKNPCGVIETFRRAFAPGDGAKLVLKSMNAATRPNDHEQVVLAADGHPDITLIDGYLSSAEKNALITQCDCFVSLHRAEGFGIPTAEAMLLEKPVIATRYGGNLEYMNDENAYLVDYEPVMVGDGVYPYPADGVWAEPNLDQAAALMRDVFSDRDAAHRKAQLAHRQLLARHSPAAAGAEMRRRLALVLELLYRRGARSLNIAHLPLATDGTTTSIADAPPIDWGPGFMGRLKRRAHRPVASWTTAYARHEHQIQAETRLAIEALDARLREVARTLQDQQNARHAEVLAELRRLREEQSPGREPEFRAPPSGG